MAAKKKAKTLDAKERAFVDEYQKDLNAMQAAIRAGYAKTTAHKKASLWVGGSRQKCPENKLHVWDAVHEALQERSERTQIDADFVLETLANWTHADPKDIIDETTGAYKRIHDWPYVWRQMLSAADVKEIWEWQNEDGERARTKVGEIIKFKFIDKVRALELLGKHVNVQAFRERTELTGPNGGPVEHHYTMEIVDPKE